MATIIFDEESRVFSVISNTEFSDKEKKGAPAWLTSKGTLGTAIGGVAGGTASALIARKKAKKAAEARGLEPGTPEYKKFVRKKTAIGAGIGTAGGALAGGALTTGYEYYKGNKGDNKLKLKDAIGQAYKGKVKVSSGSQAESPILGPDGNPIKK
jgi:hypothetical protein